MHIAHFPAQSPDHRFLLALVLYLLVFAVSWSLMRSRLSLKRLRYTLIAGGAVIIILFIFSVLSHYRFFLPSSRNLLSGKLSSETEDLLRGGIEDAQLEYWENAVLFFKEAVNVVPVPSKVLYNLGLAYERYGSRELPAFAWYRAFLSAQPDAANRSAVIERMEALKRKAVEKKKHMLTSAVHAAEAMAVYEKSRTDYHVDKTVKQGIYRNLAWAHAHSYDTETALYWASMPGQDTISADLLDMLEDRANGTRDNENDTEESGIVSGKSIKDPASKAIAEQALDMASAGKNEAALEMVNNIANIQDRMALYGNIAAAQCDNLDLAACAMTLEEAQKIAPLLSSTWLEDNAYAWISRLQAKCGAFSESGENLEKIYDPAIRQESCAAVAKLRAETGDGKGALRTLKLHMTGIRYYPEIAGQVRNRQAQETFEWMAMANECENSIMSCRDPDNWLSLLKKESGDPQALASRLSLEAERHAYYTREFFDTIIDWKRPYVIWWVENDTLLFMLAVLMGIFAAGLAVFNLINESYVLIQKKKFVFRFGFPVLFLGSGFLVMSLVVFYNIFLYFIAYHMPPVPRFQLILIFLILNTITVFTVRIAFKLMNAGR